MATDGGGEPTPPEMLAAIQDVVAKARAGDAIVLPQLRAILDRNPGLIRISGDLGRQAESAWIALASGPNLYLREALAREAEVRRAELTRSGAMPVELLLVERVVACGLQLNYLTAGDSYRQLQYHGKRIERAQRMYFNAVGALTAFQKVMPAAHVVQESASAALAAPAQSEQAVDHRPATATAAERLRVMAGTDESDEPRPKTRDRLRVGVTC